MVTRPTLSLNTETRRKYYCPIVTLMRHRALRIQPAAPETNEPLAQVDLHPRIPGEAPFLQV